MLSVLVQIKVDKIKTFTTFTVEYKGCIIVVKNVPYNTIIRLIIKLCVKSILKCTEFFI